MDNDNFDLELKNFVIAYEQREKSEDYNLQQIKPSGSSLKMYLVTFSKFIVKINFYIVYC